MKYLKLFKSFEQRKILEELNIQGTYLVKSKDDKEEFKKNVKELIDSIVQKRSIQLPIEKFGKEYLEIRNTLFKQLPDLKKLNFFKDFLSDSGELDLSNTYNKKFLNSTLQEFLLDILCDETKIKSPKKTNSFDLKKVKFDYKLKSKQSNEDIYQVILPEDVKQYIIKNKDVNYLDHIIYMSCEPDNFNRIHFGGRIDRKKIFRTDDKLGSKRSIMSYGSEYLGKSPSSYELLQGIPSSIKGLGLGYLMYKQFIQYLGFASSTKGSSKEAQEVWKKLSNDNDLTGLILNLKVKERDDVWGKILMFDKGFKGDFKKICNDFIEKSKSEFILDSVSVDDFLKSKGIN